MRIDDTKALPAGFEAMLSLETAVALRTPVGDDVSPFAARAGG